MPTQKICEKAYFCAYKVNRRKARTACFVAAPGTTTQRTAVSPIATTTRLRIGTTISASASSRPPSSIDGRMASTEQAIVPFLLQLIGTKSPDVCRDRSGSMSRHRPKVLPLFYADRAFSLCIDQDHFFWGAAAVPLHFAVGRAAGQAPPSCSVAPHCCAVCAQLMARRANHLTVQMQSCKMTGTTMFSKRALASNASRNSTRLM